jgi:hypothetical protein
MWIRLTHSRKNHQTKYMFRLISSCPPIVKYSQCIFALNISERDHLHVLPTPIVFSYETAFSEGCHISLYAYSAKLGRHNLKAASISSSCIPNLPLRDAGIASAQSHCDDDTDLPCMVNTLSVKLPLPPPAARQHTIASLNPDKVGEPRQSWQVHFIIGYIDYWAI